MVKRRFLLPPRPYPSPKIGHDHSRCSSLPIDADHDGRTGHDVDSVADIMQRSFLATETAVLLRKSLSFFKRLVCVWSLGRRLAFRQSPSWTDGWLTYVLGPGCPRPPGQTVVTLPPSNSQLPVHTSATKLATHLVPGFLSRSRRLHLIVYVHCIPSAKILPLGNSPNQLQGSLAVGESLRGHFYPLSRI